MPDLLSARPSANKEDARHCVARLRLILETLPIYVLINPVGLLVIVVAMHCAQSELGVVPLWRVVTAMSLQLVTSCGSYWVWRRYSAADETRIGEVRRALIWLQTISGLAWSATAWLLWCDGNAANNGFVVIVVAMALWDMTLTRCAVRAVFFSGLVTLSLPLAVRFAISAGVTPLVFLCVIPVWVLYMVFSGMAARTRVDEMLNARFANEDLSKELAAARDEAVTKRQEAETANASKTAFLANMSHELRTPLNAIIGFSEIITTQALGPHNERYPEYAGDVHASGTHLLTLINEILDVAKIEAGRMEIDPRPLNVSGALEGVERIMAIRAREKALDISYSVDPDIGEIVADERAFRQILLNLLSNAVKFTPQGGTIQVACNLGDEGGVVLTVTDNGPGIAVEKLKLLFQPFAQVDNRFDHHHGGTGLGLALVQGLARLHGGRAWIDSSEGIGTAVSVYFPLVAVKRALTAAMQ